MKSWFISQSTCSTVISSKAVHTLARVGVDAIYARAAVLAGVDSTVIDVCSTKHYYVLNTGVIIWCQDVILIHNFPVPHNLSIYYLICLTRHEENKWYDTQNLLWKKRWYNTKENHTTIFFTTNDGMSMNCNKKYFNH